MRKRWEARTLDGTPVLEADPNELLLEAVALAGWALDREYENQHQHWHNLGAWHWVEAARAASAELERLKAA